MNLYSLKHFFLENQIWEKKELFFSKESDTALSDSTPKQKKLVFNCMVPIESLEWQQQRRFTHNFIVLVTFRRTANNSSSKNANHKGKKTSFSPNINTITLGLFNYYCNFCLFENSPVPQPKQQQH